MLYKVILESSGRHMPLPSSSSSNPRQRPVDARWWMVDGYEILLYVSFIPTYLPAYPCSVRRVPIDIRLSSELKVVARHHLNFPRIHFFEVVGGRRDVTIKDKQQNVVVPRRRGWGVGTWWGRGSSSHQGF